jgi:protein O-mannosyl-transferase
VIPRKPLYLPAFLVGFITVAVFGRVVTCDFINFDDPDYVTGNAIVQRGISWEGVRWAFGQLHGKATYWHPITWVSHMLDCQVFGLNSQMHHFVNLLLHTGNAVLVFLVLAEMTSRIWYSFGTALFFGLHPLQVDTVAWIAERKNLLSTLFALLCLACYWRYVKTQRARSYFFALFWFAIALMCKPAVVVLPGVMLLLDYWPLTRLPLFASDPGRNKCRMIWKLLVEKVPFLALSIASSVITILGHQQLGIVTTAGAFSLSSRLENAIISYGRYLKKAFFPIGLTIHYPHHQWPNLWVIEVAALLMVISIFTVAQARRRPWLLTGLLWFLGGLVPTIGIIQVGPQAMAERFVYFPMIGLGIGLVWTIGDFMERRQLTHRVGLIVMVLVFASLSALTVRQIGFWRNSRALWEHALDVDQWNDIAENNLSLIFLEAQEPEIALQHAQTAIRLNPKAPEIWCELGNIYKAKGDWLAAITNYQRAAELNPGWLDIPLLLGQAYGKVDNVKASIDQYRRALMLNPGSIVALNNLAWILATTNDSADRNGAEAVELAKRACELSNEPPAILFGTLAAAYAEDGQFVEAVRTAREAVARAQKAGDQSLAARNLELQQRYERGRAFHGD